MRIAEIDGDPAHIAVGSGQHLHGGIRIAPPHRVGQRRDAAAEAVNPLQHDDAVADRGGRRGVGRFTVDRDSGNFLQRREGRGTHQETVGGGADDVAEDGAGLDGGQLLRVADQDQAGVGPDRLHQLGHLRQRHHRRFVDHHHVVG